MDFEQKVPDWGAAGVEPAADFKAKGFEAGYKPPAAYFNWFWNRVSLCLTEIRTKLKGHAEDTTNPHKVTAAQVGLDKVNNTADSEKSVLHASTSGTAENALRVDQSMTVKLDGGSIEGIDRYTYNGTVNKTVDITASKIGAAEKVHEHMFGRGVLTTGSGTEYVAIVEGITALTAGLSFIMIPHVVSASKGPTLNVNNLGAKRVRRPLSGSTSATVTGDEVGWLTANKPVRVTYDGSYWVADLAKPNAPDIYGTLAIANGGTGSEDGATGLKNLFAAGNTVLSSYQYGDSLPSAGTKGRIFFKRVIR